jgi:putative transposase
VVGLARDNPSWGHTKIRDALRGLKIEIGRTTVASLLGQAGIEPAPERIRKRTWKHFLRSHWETLYACDFFSVEVLGVFGTVRHMVFCVMEVKSRAVQIAGIHVAPNGDWMKQMARTCWTPWMGFCARRAAWSTIGIRCSPRRGRQGSKRTA